MNPNKVDFAVDGNGPWAGSATVSMSDVQDRDSTLALGTRFSLISFTPSFSSRCAIAPLVRMKRLVANMDPASTSSQESESKECGFRFGPEGRSGLGLGELEGSLPLVPGCRILLPAA